MDVNMDVYNRVFVLPILTSGNRMCEVGNQYSKQIPMNHKDLTVDDCWSGCFRGGAGEELQFIYPDVWLQRPKATSKS